MLNAMCSHPACRNIDETSRNHSPSRAIASGCIPHRASPPPRSSRVTVTNRKAQIPIRDVVTAPSRVSRPPKTVRDSGIDATPALRHSGHWYPTDAAFMHSGQMGRRQRVHWIHVSRSGCR